MAKSIYTLEIYYKLDEVLRQDPLVENVKSNGHDLEKKAKVALDQYFDYLPRAQRRKIKYHSYKVIAIDNGPVIEGKAGGQTDISGNDDPGFDL